MENEKGFNRSIAGHDLFKDCYTGSVPDLPHIGVMPHFAPRPPFRVESGHEAFMKASFFCRFTREVMRDWNWKQVRQFDWYAERAAQNKICLCCQKAIDSETVDHLCDEMV